MLFSIEKTFLEKFRYPFPLRPGWRKKKSGPLKTAAARLRGFSPPAKRYNPFVSGRRDGP